MMTMSSLLYWNFQQMISLPYLPDQERTSRTQIYTFTNENNVFPTEPYNGI